MLPHWHHAVADGCCFTFLPLGFLRSPSAIIFFVCSKHSLDLAHVFQDTPFNRAVETFLQKELGPNRKHGLQQAETSSRLSELRSVWEDAREYIPTRMENMGKMTLQEMVGYSCLASIS